MEEGENLAQHLLETLGIERERAEELLETIEEMATKHGNPGFLIKEWKTLFELAETPEEAFFIAHAATLLADSMAMVQNPVEFITTSIETVIAVRARAQEMLTKN